MPDRELLLAQTGWLRRLARSLVAEPGDADDLVQETMAIALRAPAGAVRHPRAWLAGVVRRAARVRRRGEARRDRRERAAARLESDPAPSAAELAERAELQRSIVAAVLALDEPYRSTVLLRYWGGRTAREIAAQQGVPAATVRSRTKRALERLRDRLDDERGGDRGSWATVLAPWALGRETPAAGLPAALGTALGAVLAVGLKTKLALGAAALAAALLGVRLASAPGPAAPEPSTPTAAAPLARALEDEPRAVEPAPAPREAAAARAAVEPPPAPAFHGRVRAPDGTPIAGASLALHGNTRDGLDAEPLAAGTTDAEGAFRIEAEPPSDAPVVLLAEADGFAPARVEPVRTDPAIEVRLGWLTDLFGRVVDAETGEPLAGVEVTAAGTTTSTDGNGTYRVAGVPIARGFGFEATHPGYAPERRSLSLAFPEPAPFDVELAPTVPISVEVIDAESGEPIAGAEVRRNGRVESAERTQADGRWTLDVARGRGVSARISKEGYCTVAWQWQAVAIEPGLAPRIPLLRAAWIEGRVTDDRGAPLGGVRVRVETDEGGGTQPPPGAGRRRELGLPGSARHESPATSASSTEDGRFERAVVPSEEPYTLLLGDGTHLDATVSGVLVRSPGERVRIEAILRRGGTVRGRVTRNGEPWAHVIVSWNRSDGTRGDVATASPEGRYELSAIEPGEVEIVVGRGRRPDGGDRARVRIGAGEVVRRDFAVTEERGEIAGRVVSSSGVPIADAKVFASLPGETRTRSLTSTAEDGTYTFDLPIGTYDVTASRTTMFAPGPDRATIAGVATGSRAPDLALPDVGRVRLKLLDATDRRPVPGGNLMLGGLTWRSAGSERFEQATRVATDAAGNVLVELPLERVDVYLRLADEGYAPRLLPAISVSSAPDPSPIVVALERGHDLVLAFVPPLDREDREGHALVVLPRDRLDDVRGPFDGSDERAVLYTEGVWLWSITPTLRYQEPRFDGAGKAVVRALAPGRYALRAFPDDIAFEPAYFDVPPIEGGPVEVRWHRR